MRFSITGMSGNDEMIGELVNIPNAPGVAFAVHPNTFKDRVLYKFCVTHVDSGLRIGTGNTIDGAIEAATLAAAAQTPEQFAENLEAGVKIREHLATFG